MSPMSPMSPPQPVVPKRARASGAGVAWRRWPSVFVGVVFALGALGGVRQVVAQSLDLPLLRVDLQRMIGARPPLGYVNDPRGVAISPAEDGRIYAVDAGHARIQVFSGAGLPIGSWGSRGDDFARGELWLPSDIAVSPDGATVYVVDRGHRRIVRFAVEADCLKGGRGCARDVWGGHGSGDGLFEDPVGLATDRSGNVYVVDMALDAVQVFDPRGAWLRTIGRNPAGDHLLLRPMDVDVAADGTIWVADFGNDRIARFDASGEPAGEFKGGNDPFYQPSGVALGRDGGFIVADYRPEGLVPRIWRFGPDRKLLWQRPIAGPSVRRGAAMPLFGLALDRDGVAVVAQPRDREFALERVLPTGDPMPFALHGRERDQFDFPFDVALDPFFTVVSDTGNGRVMILPPGEADADGVVVIDALLGDSGLVEPRGVAVHRTGPARGDARIYVADSGANSVFVFRPDGSLIDRWGDGKPERSQVGLSAPWDVAVGPDGEVYIADHDNSRIVRRAPSGELQGIIGTPGGDPGQLRYPVSIAIGPGNRLYVVERNRNRIQWFGLDGTFIDHWSGGQDFDDRPGFLWSPVALAASGHRLLVLENDERSHARVQVFRPMSGAASEAALEGVFADAVGAGPGALWNPLGLSADAAGHVMVADSGNNRLQLFDIGAEDRAAQPAATEAPTLAPTDTPEPTEAPTETPIPSPTATDTPEPSPTPLPTETPTSTPSPTATELPATATPTSASSPTASQVLPSPTLAPSATATATRTATAIPSPHSNINPTPRSRYRVFLPIEFIGRRQ